MSAEDDGTIRAKLDAAIPQARRLRWTMRGATQNIQHLGADKVDPEQCVAVLKQVLAVAEDLRDVTAEIARLKRLAKYETEDIFQGLE